MIMLKKGLLAVSLSVVLLFASCSSLDIAQLAQKQEMKLVPSPLELHGDSVAFTMSALLPVSVLKKGYTYALDVKYRPSNRDAISVGQFKFKGDDYIGKAENPRLEQRFGFIYPGDGAQGQVVVKGTASKDGSTKAPLETPETEVAKGIITTSRLVQPTYYVNYIKSQYRSIEEFEPVSTEFNFDKAKSVFRKDTPTKDRMKSLEAFIAEKNATKTVNLTGMHSPEGREAINSELANSRPKTVQDFYANMLKKYDYQGEAANINFVVKPVVQDWTEFKRLLMSYEKISQAQKDEVLAVVNGPGDFVSKELKLQTLSSYKSIVRDIYPTLRTAKTEILKVKVKKPDAEIWATTQRMLKGEENENALTVYELEYAAELATSLEDKEKIYTAAIKRNDKFYLYNNLGAVYLDMSKKTNDMAKRNELLDKAITQLELSTKKQESPQGFVNLAGAKLMKGDLAGSSAALAKVSDNGSVTSSLNAFKGYTSITKGQYDAAITALSGAGNDAVVLYNKALAYLLKASKEQKSEDLPRAEAAFKEAIEADANNAYAFYGLAIVSARQGNAPSVASNLKKAAELNSSLKSRAVTDLEFLKYFESADFINALK